MNGKAELVVSSVIDFILPERYIADGKIIEITAVGSLKSGYCNICFWIKLLCDSSRDTVQFYAI